MFDSMIKLKKPNSWSCSITAFAMATDLLIFDFIAEIGHDGSEIVFPDLPEPAGRRGFHEQELIRVCIKHGFSCTPFEFWPQAAYAGGRHVLPLKPQEQMFTELVEKNTGVIMGHGRRTPHSVAFERGSIYDPDGGPVFPFSFDACEAQGFYPNYLFLVKRG